MIWKDALMSQPQKLKFVLICKILSGSEMQICVGYFDEAWYDTENKICAVTYWMEDAG